MSNRCVVDNRPAPTKYGGLTCCDVDDLVRGGQGRDVARDSVWSSRLLLAVTLLAILTLAWSFLAVPKAVQALRPVTPTVRR